MSWSEYLYYYHQKMGGQFLGAGSNDGDLILTYRDRPLVLQNMEVVQGRYTSRVVRARTTVDLEKPYRLSIGSKNPLSTGANVALKVLNRGLDLIPNAPDVGGDYGCPEVTKDRLIRTDNRPFTKQVLGSLDLRNALLALPGATLAVKKGPVGMSLHLVEVSIAGDPNSTESIWNIGDDTLMGMEMLQEERRRHAERKFFPQVDQMLELTKAARDAIMMWRM